MARAMWRTLLASAVLTLAACAPPHPRLPEFAAPKGGIGDSASLDMSDVIPYRTLVKADFKGSQPPLQFAPYADRIGAATCGYITTTPDTRMAIQATRSRDGHVRYRAAPVHLRFVAGMDRHCSWWNPKDIPVPKAYILQHEQIHFALFELEARRMNASVPQIEARVHATAATPEAAVQAARGQLEAEVEKRLEEVLARSRAFDEDTSMGHKPAQQNRWWSRVQDELAATSARASAARE